MKKRVSPKSIAEVVSSSPMIKQLRQETRKLERLQRLIDSLLDAELVKRLQVGAIGNDYIVLIAESSAWAAKIRYIIPMILEHLRNQADYAQITTIRIRTQKYDRPAPYVPETRRLSLGVDAASAIEETAENVEDQDIAKALRRLTRHSK